MDTTYPLAPGWAVKRSVGLSDRTIVESGATGPNGAGAPSAPIAVTGETARSSRGAAAYRELARGLLDGSATREVAAP